LKTDLLKQFRFVSRKKTINFERKLITFVIFLIITTIIWFFNILHKEYTTDFVVPVDIVNINKDLIPVSSDDKTVMVKIRSSGFGLLNFLYNHKDYRIMLDASLLLSEKDLNSKIVRIGESSWYFIERFKRSFGNNVTIISVLPDSFNIEFAKAHSRAIPVKHRVNYKVPKLYVQIKNPLIFPDSVRISGPVSLIDTMKYCYTEMIDVGNIHADTSFYVGIDLPHNYRGYPDKVKIDFFIDRYSEKSFSLKPVLLNKPDSLNIIFYPELVDVRLSVALRIYNTLKKEDVIVYADFSKRNLNSNTITLELGKLPEGVFNPVLFPLSVEFLVKMK